MRVANGRVADAAVRVAAHPEREWAAVGEPFGGVDAGGPHDARRC